MKKWLSKIFGKLLAVGENRYVHSTIGALIASITLCVTLPFVDWWIAIVIAIVVAFLFGIAKEYLFDSKADWIDVLYTILGSIIVCLPVFIHYICA